MASFSVGTFQFPVAYLLNFGVALIIMVAFSAFLKQTYLGRAITAASQDQKAALLMAINTTTKNGFAEYFNPRSILYSPMD